MKERPILFSAPMVRALLDGSKVQTRREVKPQPVWMVGDGSAANTVMTVGKTTGVPEALSPYGRPGDRLWVRETFRGCRAYEVQGYAPKDWGNKPIWFEADGTPPGRPEQWALRSRPSIHMPRWASRITLEVTGVRVERLQDISEADAVAEGVAPLPNHPGRWWLGFDVSSLNYPSARNAYIDLWKHINGPGSWDASPWVWVIEFKRITS